MSAVYHHHLNMYTSTLPWTPSKRLHHFSNERKKRRIKKKRLKPVTFPYLTTLCVTQPMQGRIIGRLVKYEMEILCDSSIVYWLHVLYRRRCGRTEEKDGARVGRDRQCLREDLNVSRNLIGFKLQASFFVCFLLVWFIVCWLVGWLLAFLIDWSDRWIDFYLFICLFVCISKRTK